MTGKIKASDGKKFKEVCELTDIKIVDEKQFGHISLFQIKYRSVESVFLAGVMYATNVK